MVDGPDAGKPEGLTEEDSRKIRKIFLSTEKKYWNELKQIMDYLNVDDFRHCDRIFNVFYHMFLNRRITWELICLVYSFAGALGVRMSKGGYPVCTVCTELEKLTFRAFNEFISLNGGWHGLIRYFEDKSTRNFTRDLIIITLMVVAIFGVGSYVITRSFFV